MGFLTGFTKPSLIDAAPEHEQEPTTEESRRALETMARALGDASFALTLARDDARAARVFAEGVLAATTIEEARTLTRSFLGIAPVF